MSSLDLSFQADAESLSLNNKLSLKQSLGITGLSQTLAATQVRVCMTWAKESIGSSANIIIKHICHLGHFNVTPELIFLSSAWKTEAMERGTELNVVQLLDCFLVSELVWILFYWVPVDWHCWIYLYILFIYSPQTLLWESHQLLFPWETNQKEYVMGISLRQKSLNIWLL